MRCDWGSGVAQAGEIHEVPDIHAKEQIAAGMAEDATGQPLTHEAGYSPTPEEKKHREIKVPTLEEVIAAGHSEDAAKKIVADEQAKHDALAANPEISDEDLSKVTAETKAS